MWGRTPDGGAAERLKENPSDQPKVRVVDEDSSADGVVRLGDEERVVRLGGGEATTGEPVVARRLEVGTGKEVEARTVTVDEILDATSGVELPEIPLEEGWGGEAKRWLAVPWGWFVLILLICVGFAGWSLRHMFAHRHVTELAVTRTIELMADDVRSEAEARELCQLIEHRIASYLASVTIEERAANVRDAGRVTPLMRQWYAEHPVEPGEFLELDAFQPLTIALRPFWLVRVRTDTGMRPLMLEQTADDDVLVDWETDVCFQPMDWDRFVAERPTGEFDFRVRVAPDHFFAYEFSDEGVYRCLKLTAEGSDEWLFGYVRRGSDIDRRIVPLLGLAGSEVPMILRLRFIEGANARRAVVVSELVSERWCLVDDHPG